MGLLHRFSNEYQFPITTIPLYRTSQTHRRLQKDISNGSRNRYRPVPDQIAKHPNSISVHRLRLGLQSVMLALHTASSRAA